MKTTNKVATLAATLITIGSLTEKANAASTIISGQFSADFPIAAPVTNLSGTFSTTAFEPGVFPVTLESFELNPNSLLGTEFNITNVALFVTFDAEMKVERFFIGGGSSGSRLSGDVDFSFRWFSETSPFSPGTVDADLLEGGVGEFEGSVVVFDLDVATVPEPSSAILLGLGALGFVTRRRRTN